MKKIFSIFIFLLFLFLGCFVSLNSGADFHVQPKHLHINTINNTEFRTQNFGGIQSKEFKVDSNYLISNSQTNISQYLSSLFNNFAISQDTFLSRNLCNYSYVKSFYNSIVKTDKICYRAYVRAP